MRFNSFSTHGRTGDTKQSGPSSGTPRPCFHNSDIRVVVFSLPYTQNNVCVFVCQLNSANIFLKTTGCRKMLELKVEPLTIELIAEMLPMQDQYWKEVAGPFHCFPPDVDWPTYLKAQELGRLRVVTGRSNGILKAGAFVLIGPHPHYACTLASLTLLFVHPDYRRGREGIRLVKMAMDEAQKAGGQLFMSHGGMHNGVYKLFEFLDFEDFGRYFVKVIGDTKPVFKAV